MAIVRLAPTLQDHPAQPEWAAVAVALGALIDQLRVTEYAEWRPAVAALRRLGLVLPPAPALSHPTRRLLRTRHDPSATVIRATVTLVDGPPLPAALAAAYSFLAAGQHDVPAVLLAPVLGLSSKALRARLTTAFRSTRDGVWEIDVWDRRLALVDLSLVEAAQARWAQIDAEAQQLQAQSAERRARLAAVRQRAVAGQPKK